MIRVNQQLVLLNAESRINVTATFGADARLVQCLPDGASMLVPVRADGLTDVALPDQSRFILTTVGQSSTYDPIALQSLKLQLDALAARLAALESARSIPHDNSVPSSSPSPTVNSNATRKVATVCEHCHERSVSAVVTQDGAAVSLCKPCALALQQRLEGRVTLKVVQRSAAAPPVAEVAAPAVAVAATRPMPVERPSSPSPVPTSPRAVAVVPASPRRVVTAADIRKPSHPPARPTALSRLPAKPLPTPSPRPPAATRGATPPLPELDIDVDSLPVVDLTQFEASASLIDAAAATADVWLPNQPSTLNHDAARHRTRRAGSIVIVDGVPQHDPVQGHSPQHVRAVRSTAEAVGVEDVINGADFPLISATEEYDEPLPTPPAAVGDSEREPPPPPPQVDDDEDADAHADRDRDHDPHEEDAGSIVAPREPLHTFRDKSELSNILTLGLGRDPRAGMIKGAVKVAMSPRPTSPPPALVRATSPRPTSPVAAEVPPQPPQPHVSVRPEAPTSRPSVGTGGRSARAATLATDEKLAPVTGAAVLEGELMIRETARTWKTQFIRIVPPFAYVFDGASAATPRMRLALSGASVDEFQTAKISHTLMIRNGATSWLLACADDATLRRWIAELRACCAATSLHR